ncbi:winged helix-turn-helix transcriptional regulator [Candidatus Nitrospira allomarina]|jgi:DNA-binding HxlR family transcriptional regulator|uniref:winged helix-turn-helix transcriptional regulator n=1 Tax=Candidatus Nitrospira allomarina TaxID=3020900 RepID=UPI00289CCF5C|nr:helix-turn-helix domain-containing protein [Candidatus Nitrospira allomarina]
MKLPPSSFGCPLDSLLRVLAGPWTIYILCRLHNNGDTRFGQLKRQMPGISSKMLTERLRALEKAEIIFRHQAPTIPPQVTYGLTTEGRELTTILDQINTLAGRWQNLETKKTANTNIQVKDTKRRKTVVQYSRIPPSKKEKLNGKIR